MGAWEWMERVSNGTRSTPINISHRNSRNFLESFGKWKTPVVKHPTGFITASILLTLPCVCVCVGRGGGGGGELLRSPFVSAAACIAVDNYVNWINLSINSLNIHPVFRRTI